MKLEFSWQIFDINTQTSNFMNIRPVGAEFLYAGGQAGRHDEGNSRFFANLRTRQKFEGNVNIS
jgi:hypothetical protein